jgi:transcriptional regulator with XRE-family HTH domain
MSKNPIGVYMTGEEAKAIRKELGWTIEQMGHAIGLEGAFTRQNYYQFEAGIRGFSVAQAHLLRAIHAGYRPMADDDHKTAA